jgi:hypothetical protein
MRSRFRRLTDLFVEGQPVAMPDGTYLWVQVLNAYQRDECLSDAQVAKARLVLALKEQGDEALKVRARFLEHGAETLVRDLANNGSARKVSEFMEAMQDEPEWKERMNILLRTDTEEAARPLEQAEAVLITKINKEVLEELRKREEDELAFLTRKYSGYTDEDLIDAWVDDWLEKRGSEIATAEYKLTEMTYATRFCEATKSDDGTFDHSGCDGHSEPFFTSKSEARECPTMLALLITTSIADLNMVGRDPKGSGRPQSSSG